MKSIEQAKIGSGIRVLLRADFNVAIQGGAVVDDFRIRKTVPTLDLLKKQGANVVMMSHIENAAGVEGKATLRPVIDALAVFLTGEKRVEV